MIDVGDLVMMRYSPNKIGLVVDKKIQQDSPYAGPLGEYMISPRVKDALLYERLKFLCYWTSGEHQWVDASLLVAVEGENIV